MPATAVETHRKATDRGRKLEYFTIAWNSIEALVAVAAGISAGSVSMVGFGTDSFIEVISGGALLWRMSIDHEDPRRKRREKIALKVVSICFLALAAYITIESLLGLAHKKKPEHGLIGIILASVSLVVMPLFPPQKTSRKGSQEPRDASRCPANSVWHISIGDSAGRTNRQCGVRLVVGGCVGRAGNGATDCQGRD